MTLYEQIKELINISSQDLKITVNRYYDELLVFRTAYRNSLRNTVNKEIENSCDSSELNKLIFTFESQLEQSLVISLYRRYLWLEPTNTVMYQRFINYLGKNEQEKLKILIKALDADDFDTALSVVEEIFDNTFNFDPTLIKPINLRTLVDIATEYNKLDNSPGIASMEKTEAARVRKLYLKDVIDDRINDPDINIIELREFFTNGCLFISLPCEVGLAVGKRYFNLNKSDREMYARFCNFLGFWHLGSDAEILQYIAVNDFDNAFKVANAIVY
jgi:hypothetical protein